MKLVIGIFVGLLSMSSLAKAETNFDSGSAQLTNAVGTSRGFDRSGLMQVRNRPMERRVRCRDGSRHIPRVCRRHGGIARR